MRSDLLLSLSLWNSPRGNIKHGGTDSPSTSPITEGPALFGERTSPEGYAHVPGAVEMSPKA